MQLESFVFIILFSFYFCKVKANSDYILSKPKVERLLLFPFKIKLFIYLFIFYLTYYYLINCFKLVLLIINLLVFNIFLTALIA